MTNLSILAQNTCAGLSDEAQALYLRGAGRNELKAFWMACEWDDVLSEPIRFMCDASSKVYAEQAVEAEREQLPALDLPNLPNVASEVYDFIKERHYRTYFPDGRSA